MKKSKSDLELLHDVIDYTKIQEALGEAIRHLCLHCYPGNHGGVSIKCIQELGELVNSYARAAGENNSKLGDRMIKRIVKEQREKSATEAALKSGPQKAAA